MSLTPIKVKGRGRRKKWQPPDPSRIRNNRRKREDEDDQENAASHSSKSPKRLKKNGNKKSELEQLPTELFWPIAVMSQNPNLMMVNKQFRKTLSARSFLLELAVGAFGPTWDKYFGLSKASLLASRQHETDQCPGDYKFQGDVLAARWMNIDLLLQAQQVWYRQQGTKRCWKKSQCIYWTLNTQTPQDQEGQQAEGVHEAQEAGDKEPDVPEIQVWFDQEWQEFRGAFSAVDDHGSYKRGLIMGIAEDKNKGYLDLHPLTPVPDRLLKGPFDLQKTKLLFWLVRGGARILPQHSWEVTRVGFEQIMSLEGDNITLAPYLLFFYHRLGVFEWGHWPDFVLQEKADWLDEMLRKVSRADAPEKYRLYKFTLLWVFQLATYTRAHG
ncbi:hypothetical protein QBC40DRAFT_259859 [Triangularia verruculosa]|uniref:Uncharacterized protein n=1 Tax=Triangularia verruculosa TaxID=2587418 RepID=A0AAN6X9L5_9PEZI|nr:hypothetical protein QBC40DRAFT_259859 [Triangularia verruculosa]